MLGAAVDDKRTGAALDLAVKGVKLVLRQGKQHGPLDDAQVERRDHAARVQVRG